MNAFYAVELIVQAFDIMCSRKQSKLCRPLIYIQKTTSEAISVHLIINT